VSADLSRIADSMERQTFRYKVQAKREQILQDLRATGVSVVQVEECGRLIELTLRVVPGGER
jgi:hypothetical protein